MPGKLQRRLGLFQSTAINMIDMVGIGPFVTLPLVIDIIGGPQFLYAWIAGAFISFIDAMIWSELGAAYPMAGGSYNFLKVSYGKRWGNFLSFLYVWQTLIQAPLVVASGAIGFAQYFSYLVQVTPAEQKTVSALVVICISMLLYRKIETIGKISSLLWVGVIITICWIIFSGVACGNFLTPIKSANETFHFGSLFFVALGQASVKTIYSYLGYYNVCHLGGEIIHPEKNIPRSMFISVIAISVLYFLMNVSVVSVIPWQDARHSQFIVSTFIEKIYGVNAARFATVLILWIAFASLFAVLLGYSRIPYAAAVDGSFFKIFAKLHPTKNFPHISLIAIGFTALIFSIQLRLSDVITAILAMRIIIQFIGQAVGLILLRSRNKSAALPFKMPLYPLPVIAAIIIWIIIFISTGPYFMLKGAGVIASGIIAFLIKTVYEKRNSFL